LDPYRRVFHKREILVVAIVTLESERRMKLRAVSGIVLALLLVGALVLAYDIEKARGDASTHDVAVTNITTSRNAVGQGHSLSVNVSVENQGDYTETFTVTVYAATTAIATFRDITLTSGDSTIMTFTWDTTGFAKGNHTLSAIATPVPGETDTLDNILIDGWVVVTTLGDVDGDFDCDADDVFTYLAAAYGSKIGDPNYDPNCDFDEDGDVDPDDVFTYLAPNYVRTREKFLYVEGFDGKSTANWYRVDPTDYPWLDDRTDSYVASGTLHANISWFDFKDTNLAPQQVFLEIEGRGGDTDDNDEGRFYLHNGERVHDLGELHFDWGGWEGHEVFEWKQINVTSILDDNAKLCSAKLKIECHVSTSLPDRYLRIRRARLRIFVGPHFSDAGVTDNVAGKPVTFYCKWTDPDGLYSYAFNHNSTGAWLSENVTGSLSGTEDWSNVSVVLNSSSRVKVCYRFWASDAKGNWEATPIYEFYVLWSRVDREYLNCVGGAGGMALYHSLGRKSFWGKNSERWWIFWYGGGGKQVYSSSTDGIYWETPTTLRTGCLGGGGRFYAYYEDHGGVDYVHYQYGDEAEGADVYYRRGVCNSDGTITWSDEEQVAVQSAKNLVLAPQGIAITPSGYVFMGYDWRIGTGWGDYRRIHCNVTYCTTANGTWITEDGYPKQIDGDYSTLGAVELTVWSMGEDGDCYAVMSTSVESGYSAGGYIIQGRMIDNNRVQPLENITNYDVREGRLYSVVSVYGEVHLVYIEENNETIRYCWRNAKSGKWDIQDELVSGYTTRFTSPISSYTYPVIGFDDASNRTFVNWFTRQDESGWCSVRENGLWTERERIVHHENLFIDADPNIVTPIGHMVMFSFVAYNGSTAKREIWSYVYQPFTKN